VSLEIRGLCRRFGTFALEGVSLSLPAGAYGILLGPSGSGKSLLLQTVAGLHESEAGTIAVGGRDVSRLPAERRGVGLVFQRSALFPHHDVRGNIEYGLRVRGLPAAERRARVEEMVKLLGLEAIASRPVATLSGGEGQRVAIARSLAVRPAVLLLDEPLGLVDAGGRRELRDGLRQVHRELGLTTLHVTHDREEALALGDVCAVMLHGAIEQAGPTAEVFARPASEVVARFLGVA
jgi:ABC-type Fe3+/spermidine/putrescine transport system ATPase subunit